ncbi:hypothetical protein GON03_19245 [Nocardioides sp. MAH-18]|uniref:Uncharacterized protein n=1 Tax=Nocardioides agri TaxID=2682843 RepID=A0A6L6XVA3_9ACTN|nr:MULTISPECIES: hypothetical protein [unclassified Nocardioides]MBA2952155.1 hypothetical protein [Nocardioides sp. CGMCC 1.13656]MVQ51321.1 hypothetical protein [Nocardioides sp. MAH-18]
MNAPDPTPDLAAVYVHPCNGRRYRIREVTDHHLVLVRVDVHEPGIGHLISREAFEGHYVKVDDLTGLVDVLGILVDSVRRSGEQPAVEFTAGPTGFGPQWSDANLARVFGLDQPAGGAS